MNSKTLCSTRKYSGIKREELKAKKKKIGTYEINKISLSVFDNERFVLNYGINTFANLHED